VYAFLAVAKVTCGGSVRLALTSCRGDVASGQFTAAEIATAAWV
jgi:hypothetical protein